ncbi:MAG: ABC transporter ATP-binding protein [Mycoplasma sp.]|nr:ABC transporter ATP-binding protein [Mycoplasma sp.]
MIKIENVSKKFKKFYALKNINLEIKEGEKVAILGHNGSGKSTLVDIIVGSSAPTDGKVIYNMKNDVSFNDVLGVQFQSKDFPYGLKGIDILKFYLTLYNIKKNDPYLKRILKKFAMEPHLKKPLKRLSGGQQQKLNILISILIKPKVLVLDEVTTALDITSRSSVIEIIKSVVKDEEDMTLILVSHSPLEISELADRLIVLKDGEVIGDEKLKDVVKKYNDINVFLESLKSGDYE